MKASDLPKIEEKYARLRKLQIEAVRVFLEKRQIKTQDYVADLILANALRDSDAYEDVFWLVSEVRRLREAIQEMNSDLGSGHLTPVAYDIGKKALEG